jgi:hypothetical protein
VESTTKGLGSRVGGESAKVIQTKDGRYAQYGLGDRRTEKMLDLIPPRTTSGAVNVEYGGEEEEEKEVWRIIGFQLLTRFWG